MTARTSSRCVPAFTWPVSRVRPRSCGGGVQADFAPLTPVISSMFPRLGLNYQAGRTITYAPGAGALRLAALRHRLRRLPRL